jgi:hypothetical protein
VGYRVDSISVTMEVYQEFEGRYPVTFSYVPVPDDPLVAMLLAKALSINLAAAEHEPQPQIIG